MSKFVKNISFDNNFENFVLNDFDITKCLNTGNFHVELYGISRVESTLICLICKDSYVQQSQRYVENDESMFKDMIFDSSDLNEEFKALCRQSLSIYERMTEIKPESEGKSRTTEEDYKWGIPKEDARYMLPLSCNTNISITMSGYKFKLFSLLLYYMSDSISKDTFQDLSIELYNKNNDLSKPFYKMLKKYGKGSRNPVSIYFKNEEFLTTPTPCKFYMDDVKLSDLAIGTLMSSSKDPEDTLMNQYSTQEDQEKLVLRVAGKGHYSILEQIRFTTDTYCSLTCFHQLIRHRLYDISPIGFVQLAKSKYSNYVIPNSIKNSKFFREVDDLIAEWSDFIHRAIQLEPRNYCCLGALLNCQVIPFSLNTNIRADMEVMKQRLCLNAQWEIRDMMLDRKAYLLNTQIGFIYKKFAKPNCQTIGCQEGNYAHPLCKESGRCNGKKCKED